MFNVLGSLAKGFFIWSNYEKTSRLVHPTAVSHETPYHPSTVSHPAHTALQANCE